LRCFSVLELENCNFVAMLSVMYMLRFLSIISFYNKGLGKEDSIQNIFIPPSLGLFLRFI